MAAMRSSCSDADAKQDGLLYYLQKLAGPDAVVDDPELQIRVEPPALP